MDHRHRATAHLYRRVRLWFVAFCTCGKRIPADQVMCSICANK